MTLQLEARRRPGLSSSSTDPGTGRRTEAQVCRRGIYCSSFLAGPWRAAQTGHPAPGPAACIARAAGTAAVAPGGRARAAVSESRRRRRRSRGRRRFAGLVADGGAGPGPGPAAAVSARGPDSGDESELRALPANHGLQRAFCCVAVASDGGPHARSPPRPAASAAGQARQAHVHNSASDK